MTVDGGPTKENGYMVQEVKLGDELGKWFTLESKDCESWRKIQRRPLQTLEWGCSPSTHSVNISECYSMSQMLYWVLHPGKARVRKTEEVLHHLASSDGDDLVYDSWKGDECIREKKTELQKRSIGAPKLI